MDPTLTPLMAGPPSQHWQGQPIIEQQPEEIFERKQNTDLLSLDESVLDWLNNLRIFTNVSTQQKVEERP